MNRRSIFPTLKQMQQGSRGSQNSQDLEGLPQKNVLEEPEGPVEFQVHGRHRDQRMRMEDQDFDLQRFSMLWDGKEYEDFPGNVNYPRGEESAE